jgi:hypothetical protein
MSAGLHAPRARVPSASPAPGGFVCCRCSCSCSRMRRRLGCIPCSLLRLHAHSIQCPQKFDTSLAYVSAAACCRDMACLLWGVSPPVTTSPKTNPTTVESQHPLSTAHCPLPTAYCPPPARLALRCQWYNAHPARASDWPARPRSTSQALAAPSPCRRPCCRQWTAGMYGKTQQ